jgi:4-diphosphocytidyl-2-C-methyl-D-erythritol kinase
VIAGAKINLSLRVGPLRADGYHDVATVLAALALGDSLELEPAAATRVEAPGLAGGDSLATRALGLLAARTGHGAGWRVHIDKHVPVGAGLGGGSADAAAALRLANATLPEPLALGDLTALAAEVGSDVPFFVSGHETALARGRGELLEPCPVRAPAWVVVAWQEWLSAPPRSMPATARRPGRGSASPRSRLSRSRPRMSSSSPP